MRVIRGRFGYTVTWWRRWSSFGTGWVNWDRGFVTRHPVARLGDGRKGNILYRNWRYVQRARTGYVPRGSAA